jgi:hypothetical protein
MDEKLIAFAAVVAFVVFIMLFVWFESRHDRAFNRELAQRTSQTPDEFASFYSTVNERSIALRLLPLYARFFGIETGKLRPQDCPPIIVEIDHVELIQDIETEFGISISDRDAEGINGSFDSIVQFLAKNRQPDRKSSA